jgi:hypothetical protein
MVTQLGGGILVDRDSAQKLILRGDTRGSKASQGIECEIPERVLSQHVARSMR